MSTPRSSARCIVSLACRWSAGPYAWLNPIQPRPILLQCMIPQSLDITRTVHLHVDMKSSPGMTIGELAAQHGLGTHVLRHWEDMELLTPERTSTGRRVYGPADAVRVGLILLAKD